jgi:hypothetical protein
MAIYKTSQQLSKSLQLLFERVYQQDPAAAEAVSKSNLIIRLRLSAPKAEVVINGRKNPPQITYGNSSLKPDLDVDLTADALHYILLGELPLGKALANGQMKVHGPVWKSFVLANIFHSGQAIYPALAGEIGLGS